MRVEKQPEPAFAKATAGQEKKVEPFVAPQPVGKVIFLAVLTVVASCLFWYSWQYILQHGIDFSFGTSNIVPVIVVLLTFCLMLCLMAVFGILVTRWWVKLLVSSAAATALFIFFPVSLWSVVGAAVAILGLLYWFREMAADQKSRLKFMPLRTVGAGLKSAVSLVLITLSLLYYSFLTVGPQAREQFTDSLVQYGSRAVQNVMRMYYKDKFSPRMRLDDFIANVSGVSGDALRLETGQGELDTAIREGLSAAGQQAVTRARQDFLKTFGIEASGDEEMQQVVEKIVKSSLDTYLGKYTKFIPALLAVSLFFILNVFSFIYRELTKSLSYLLFHVLVWVKFISVKKVQVEAEKITL